jgi:hypothetical protein
MMRSRKQFLGCLLPVLIACDEPAQQRSKPDVPPVASEVREPQSPAETPSDEPRDAPAGQWSTKVYDERLVWLDPAAATELALELGSGVVTMTTTPKGVRIDGIGRGAVAAEIGLRPGDVITSVEGGPPTAVGLHDAWARARRTEVIDLERLRDGETTTVRLWLSGSSREPPKRQVAAAVAYLGVRVLDESRRVIDRELLRALAGSSLLAGYDTLWRSLGIPSGSTIARIDEDNLTDRRAAFEALVARADAKAFEVLVVDDREQRTLQYEVGEGIMPKEALDRVRSDAEAETLRRPPVGGSTRLPEDLAEQIDEKIEVVSDDHYRIDKEFLSDLMANPSNLARQARIIPAQKDGEVVGFKFYGIRRGSLLGRLGFQNGDTLTAVNGKAVDGVDQALEAYTDFRTAETLKVDLIRRGKELTLQIDIE